MTGDWTTGEPRIVVVACDQCGHRWYLPRRGCPLCGGTTVTRRVAEGGGTCVAVTWLHTRGGGATSAADGRGHGLALVELDEGPVVMGRVHLPDLGPELVPGSRARVELRAEDGVLLPSFTREITR